MKSNLLMAALLAFSVLAVPAFSEAPVNKKVNQLPSEAYAQWAWSLTDLVLQNHIDPPTRQEMLLQGAKALLKTSKIHQPADLSRRISNLTTQEQYARFLQEIWPKWYSGENWEKFMMEGMLQAVPGKPNILPPEYLKTLEVLAGNKYVGTGIQIAVNKEENVPQILNPFRRGPARRAGSMPGDLILSVDGKATKDVPLQKIVAWLRGEAGTKVSVVVRQPKATETRTLHIVRDVIPFDTVYGFHRLSEVDWDFRADAAVPIGYIWIKTVNASTLHELRKVERQLRTEGIRGLVIDLRFSDGSGAMHEMELVADGLLEGGIMWKTRDAKNQVKEFKADRECLFQDLPLVVLINEDVYDNVQAGIAAALQDNGRALIVGQAPKADGFVKTILNLPHDQGAVTLRTSQLVRAGKQRNWNVTPDHLVATNLGQKKAIRQWLMDKDLPELPAGKTDTAPDDPQLAKALDLLRGNVKAASAVGKK